MGRHNNEMTSQQRENDETEADSQNQFYEQEHGANLPRMRTEESGLNAATGKSVVPWLTDPRSGAARNQFEYLIPQP